MERRFTFICLLILCALWSTAGANEWRTGTLVDNDWYTGGNWSAGHSPTASEAVEWRNADLPSHELILSGGTVSTLANTCNIWYAGTASFTVTGGANYTTTGTMGLYNGAADAVHSPCNVTLTINGASTFTLAGEAQVGRQFTASSSVTGQCTVNVDGAGTVLNQTSGYWWMGWGDGHTEQTKMNISNGAVVNLNALSFQPDSVNGIVPVINIAGGYLTIAGPGDRSGAVNGTYVPLGYIKAYDGNGTVVCRYDSNAPGKTRVWSIPLPPSSATEIWLGTLSTNFYDGKNYSPQFMGSPTSGTTVKWDSALDGSPSYKACVINGGTAASADCHGFPSSGSYVATFKVTNGATYTIASGGTIQMGCLGNNAKTLFVVDNGATVTTPQLHMARDWNSYTGTLDRLDVNGVGSVVNITEYAYIGHSSQPGPGIVNVVNGGQINFAMNGGLILNYANTDDAKINVAGGSITIAGDRDSVVGGYINSGWIVAYNGTGTILHDFDDGNNVTRIWSSPVPPPVAPVVSTKGAATVFWDDFNTYRSGAHACGLGIKYVTPLIGASYVGGDATVFGGLTVLDCSMGNDGNSMSIQRTEESGPMIVYGYPKPAIIAAKGFTYRLETDVYLPGPDTSASCFISCGQKVNPNYGLPGHEGESPTVENEIGWGSDIYGRLYYSDGFTYTSQTGKSLGYNQWVHVRMDVYDNNTVWMWYTTPGGSETAFVKGAAYSLDLSSGNPIRPNFSQPAVNAAPAYFDNVKMQMIDNTPMGYPTIHPITSAITADGSINTGTEWAGVKKIASKPAGSKGNFNPTMAANYYLGLGTNTTVDVYAGYDKSFFYVGVVGSTITMGGSDSGYVDAVFTFDTNGVSPTKSYVYRMNAKHATGTLADKGILTNTGYSETNVAADFNSFTLANGAMGYTVSSGVMRAEYKIPMAFMPEFTGIRGQGKVNVQINYIEANAGDHRGTTNLIGSFIPDQIWGTGMRYAPLVSGVKFPMDGDFNGDCSVNMVDLRQLAQDWLSTTSGTDINIDGRSNLKDFGLMGRNWLYVGNCD